MGEKEAVPPKYVTEAQLEEFVKVVREAIGRMRKDIEALQLRAEESPEAKVKYIHCTEKGCDWQTDDVGAYFKHRFDEEMRKLSETAPKGHRTVEEFTECKECFPKLLDKIEPALIERGWKKPIPYEPI